MNRVLRTAARIMRGGPKERLLIRKKITYRTLSRFTPIIGVQTPYGTFALDSNDHGPGESMYAFKGFDDYEVLQSAVAELRRFGRFSRDISDLAFVDVGANVGTTTIPALTSLGFGRSISIEPAPQNLRLLRANIALNDLGARASVVASAIGAETGRLRLWLGTENHGDHRLWHTDGLELQPMQSADEVDVLPLDDLLATEQQVGLVWVDTQGYEGQVLAGATNVRSRGIPFVTEFWPTGMRAANTWEQYRQIVSTAQHLKDLRSGEVFETVDERTLDQLGRKYEGVSTYTDLLMWFA